jgi:AcrR family transcriptional regulator
MPLATPPDVELSRRERKKQHTRHSLRTHALRLFAERGFDATTIHDITEAADVAPRTFFLHYGSKEDLLLGDAQAGLEMFEEILAGRPAEEDAYSAVRAAAVGALASDESAIEEFMLQARLMKDAPHLMGRVAERHAEYEQIITRRVAERYGLDPETDAYPRLLAACTMTAVRVGLGLWYSRGADKSFPTVVDELLDELGRGFVSGPKP